MTQIHHSNSHIVNGCAIIRGVDKWTVRRTGEHLGETDTFVEAERVARDTPESVRYTAPQRYALVTEATEAAREMGLSVKDIW